MGGCTGKQTDPLLLAASLGHLAGSSSVTMVMGHTPLLRACGVKAQWLEALGVQILCGTKSAFSVQNPSSPNKAPESPQWPEQPRQRLSCALSQDITLESWWLVVPAAASLEGQSQADADGCRGSQAWVLPAMLLRNDGSSTCSSPPHLSSSTTLLMHICLISQLTASWVHRPRWTPCLRAPVAPASQCLPHLR